MKKKARRLVGSGGAVRTRLVVMVMLSAALFLAISGSVAADGLIVPVPIPGRPPIPLRSLTIKYHRVTVSIDNQVATTHVDQVFVNETGYDMEGDYIFPLPEDASISQFAMWVDGRRLEAEVLEREEARQIYEDIVRQRRDPALLEYAGRNAFRARIYPIPARGEKRIELEYSELLTQDTGLVRYVYPLNTEKFSARPLEDVRVTVRIESRESLKAIYSPSHEIGVDRKDAHLAIVGYEASNVTPDRDFVLYYAVAEDALGINVISYREPGEDGYFVLLAAPRIDVDAGDIVARDVFIVLDVSGSMRGKKLTQAQGAVRYILDNLNDDDRFNIIAFGTGTKRFASRLQPLSQMDRAHAFISSLRAGGGTNISRAFEETLKQTGPRRPQIVLFLTDGLPTQGEVRAGRILERVGDLASDNVRIFSFGVGYDVNALLLDALSQDHQGTSVYVLPGEDIEVAVSSYYEKISAPVLTDIAIDMGRVHVDDLYPYPLPDLFVGSQLVLAGRYRNAATTEVTVRGVANGKTVRYTYRDIRFRNRGGAEFIPRLWATRKIGHLLTQIRLHGSERELIDEVIALSVRYGIVTPYTSFLVDETEDALTADGRRTIAKRKVEAARPAGDASVPYAAGGGRGGASPTMGASEGLRQYAPPEAVSGKEAVEKSIAQKALREADVAAEPETEQVRTIGNKAFVLRDGVWTDTTYDASQMETEGVAFGSPRYFELLTDHPEWGRYLALGPRVLLVWDGQAYKVGDEEGSPSTVEPSTDPSSGTSTGNTGQETPSVTPRAPDSGPTLAARTPTATPTPGTNTEPAKSMWERIADWLSRILGK